MGTSIYHNNYQIRIHIIVWQISNISVHTMWKQNYCTKNICSSEVAKYLLRWNKPQLAWLPVWGQTEMPDHMAPPLWWHHPAVHWSQAAQQDSDAAPVPIKQEYSFPPYTFLETDPHTLQFISFEEFFLISTYKHSIGIENKKGTWVCEPWVTAASLATTSANISSPSTSGVPGRRCSSKHSPWW